MVLTEKLRWPAPQAEGKPMVDAVEEGRRPQHGHRYNYRRVPAVMLIKQHGRRRQARPHFPLPRQVLAGLDHFPDVPQGGRRTWRLDVDAAGSGVTGDLLAHCTSTARIWITRDIASLTAMTETFIKERTHAETSKSSDGGHRRRAPPC